MSAIWLLVLATGVMPFQPSDSSSAQIAAAAVSSPAENFAVPTVAEATTRSPQQWREAVAAALKQLNSAKLTDRAAAVTAMTDLYREISRDHQLAQAERSRLAAQLHARLERYAVQLRYESAHGNALAQASSAASSSTTSRLFQAPAKTSAPASVDSLPAGAAGGPAAEGLDQLVDLIQMTLGGPDNWLPPQKAINPLGGQGNAGFGAGAAGQNGNRAGGAAGGAGGLEQGAQANGEALVDLIEKTIAPESWDINGGAGSIVYFGNFHALVVRQSEEGQSHVGDLLKALGR